MPKRAIFERSRQELSLDVSVGVHILLVVEQSSLESRSRGCAKAPILVVTSGRSLILLGNDSFILTRSRRVLIFLQTLLFDTLISSIRRSPLLVPYSLELLERNALRTLHAIDLFSSFYKQVDSEMMCSLKTSTWSNLKRFGKRFAKSAAAQERSGDLYSWSIAPITFL